MLRWNIFLRRRWIFLLSAREVHHFLMFTERIHQRQECRTMIINSSALIWKIIITSYCLLNKRTYYILEDIRPPKLSLKFHTVLAADFSPLRFYTVGWGVVSPSFLSYSVECFLCKGQTETLLIACHSVPTWPYLEENIYWKKILNKGSDKIKNSQCSPGIT